MPCPKGHVPSGDEFQVHSGDDVVLVGQTKHHQLNGAKAWVTNPFAIDSSRVRVRMVETGQNLTVKPEDLSLKEPRWSECRVSDRCCMQLRQVALRRARVAREAARDAPRANMRGPVICAQSSGRLNAAIYPPPPHTHTNAMQ